MLNGHKFFSRLMLSGSAALVMLAPAGAASAEQYKYDALGRLIRVTYDTGAVVQYSYDAAGNRTTVVSNLTVNHPPVAANDSASVGVSAAVAIMVRANDSDPDGDPLTVTSVSTPIGGGTVAIQGGGTHVVYTAPATSGPKSFTYDISDGRGGSSTATVAVTVTGTNQPPVAVADTGIEIERYTTDYIYVLGNDSDPDGDPLTIISVTGAGASIGPGGAYLVYAAGGLGIKTLQYTVSDGRGGTASASVQITVTRTFPSALEEGAEAAAEQAPNADSASPEEQ